MPIKISRKENEIAWLCDDVWELSEQLKELEIYLAQENEELTPSKYIADIGFSPRDGAAVGGYSLSVETMQSMVALGMELHLSEYPEFVEDENSE